MKSILVGKGQLSWNRNERVSDRYGSVNLWDEKGKDMPPSAEAEKLVGNYGHLLAVVIETRQSEHIGDFARGLYPSTPNVGERIHLGTGKLFFEVGSDGETNIGLEPANQFGTWLDAKSLYRCHEQTVELYFIPAT